MGLSYVRFQALTAGGEAQQVRSSIGAQNTDSITIYQHTIAGMCRVPSLIISTLEERLSSSCTGAFGEQIVDQSKVGTYLR